MSKALLLLILIIPAAMLTGCPYPNTHDQYVLLYSQGTIPETVSALAGANSIYDDYNMGPPPSLDSDFPLYFSSNRATSGGNFNVESFMISVNFGQTDGVFALDASPLDPHYLFPSWSPLYGFPSTWQSMNSAANEFGPYYSDINATQKLIMFASDRAGNLDIYHTVYDATTGFGPPVASNALNSGADDAYPSIGPDGSIYFSSNRNGGYDIFYAPVAAGTDIVNFLSGPVSLLINPVIEVNSASDDKAPFIAGNLIVFASDRPGGFGGFDLWYARYSAGVWGQPVNFGPTINSAYDEFRPVVIAATDFTNDMMLFSSNRPGGMGGFDLYYVGIPKLR